MKILVPTDFSENANNALDFATEIAKVEKAEITILYAFFAVYDFAAQATEIISNIERDAKNQMQEISDRLKKQGLTIDYKILQGSVATAVTSFAYREEYDLIVMGTQGASGIKKALIGSNTSHVIKDAMTTVLAVPNDADLPSKNKICVGLELLNETEKQFKNLFTLTSKLGLPYEFFHICKELSFDKSIELKGLESYLKETYPHIQASFVISNADNPEEGMRLHLEKNPNSILVTFSKNKTFYEYLFNKSTSVEMAYHTHVPLLVIK
ncbi:universal stress protein [Mongoliibacter ruber]|uniref:Nucleotide-binding universal stress UspA family protein n=1 Tax=Mongoliibacter ruber TaxID=1750599 RepID=A0A2T0WK85_9BACT|nr:universal stress protein [Mongoliibacter ruber]PRY87107.1 nucleotide-binding universal stress UspA family protein [Mongoliibacter ruber]